MAGTHETNPEFALRGINHLALVCRDMQETVDFYTGVLGMKLVKTLEYANGSQHFFSHSIVFSGRGYHCSAKPSRGEDLQIEEPVACWYTPAFHFHPTLPSMLGSTLIRDQVVEVCQSCEKRFLTAPWVMKPFHGEEFPLDGVVGLI